MRSRNLLLVLVIFLALPAALFGQNLFTEKIDMCGTAKYCMDCGTPQATCDAFTLSEICDKINYRYNFKDGFGSMSFQVLVDAAGNSCVLSYSDASHSGLSRDLIMFLNTCIWRPARVDGKPVNSSVNVVFTIAYGKISGRMQRMDLSDMRSADSATVSNTQYRYNNPSLGSYNFSIFTRYNSPLPDNKGQDCLVDQNDILWYATSRGLTRYDGKSFNPVNEGNSPFASITSATDLAVDKENNKWMYANNKIYMCNDNTGWQVFDSLQMGIPKPYRIITTPTGEVLLPNAKGLMILRGGKKILINKSVVWQLPSNNVVYAYYDSKSRLWIGTARGTIMIDKKQNVTVFNGSRTPMDNATITSMIEDKNGNLYFGIQSVKPGSATGDGLAIMNATGKWAYYNDKNSGMPVNQVSSLLFDKAEHILWIGTRQAGLVRFDLKDGWENYHNNNSSLPGHNINGLAQDSKGTIYVATVNGMVAIRKSGLL